MKKRSHSLQFRKKELTDHEKKADYIREKKKTEQKKQAEEKPKPRRKRLKQEARASAKRKEKLCFEKKKPERLPLKKHLPVSAAVSVGVHHAVSEQEDESVGRETADFAWQAAETAGHGLKRMHYAQKQKAYEKAEKLHRGRSRERPKERPFSLSKVFQKKTVRKQYADSVRRGVWEKNGTTPTLFGRLKSFAEKAVSRSHGKALLYLAVIGLFLAVTAGGSASCSAMMQGGMQMILATSFTAEDADILGAEEDYKALENKLRREVDSIEKTFSGYDEYRYILDNINHNPYQLISYLTVLFEDFTREEVQGNLRSLFRAQYDLKLETETEQRTRRKENGETEPYLYRILKVTLINNRMGAVIEEALEGEDLERWRIMVQVKGNRPELFAGDIYAEGGEDYLDYNVSAEALTDEKFENMLREAEKYLGMPYVWGGGSPAEGFDCSGYVSWVLNHCGNGWSFGRQTANGLKNICAVIPPEKAKAGDLIFFKGTYETAGASHVGIYVGDGMMIHCGDPISYASVRTSYWKKHFYCYGRIPD